MRDKYSFAIKLTVLVVTRCLTC